MAITQDHPRIKVEIVVDGVSLEEFNDEDEQSTPNSVTKYIESRSGAEFVIKCTLTKPWPEYDLLLNLFLDGKCVRGTYLMHKNFPNGDIYVKTYDGVHHSKGQDWFLRKFCFSDLTIDDSGAGAVSDQLMKDLKGVGEIWVEVHRVDNLRQTEGGIPRPKDINHLDEVPEKALKGRALSHQSGLKPAVATTASTVWQNDFVDGEDYPCAFFNFKYRSKRALQSLLIVPRSPSPVPLEERDVDTLTPEESRELIRRLRERDQAAQAVKREGVKRERSPAGSRSTENMGAEDGDEVSLISASKRRHILVTIDEDGVETIDLT